MHKRNFNHTISVDSETGEYWDGHRALKNQSQINLVIEKVSTGRSVGNDDVVRVRGLFQLVVVKITKMVICLLYTSDAADE